MLFIIQLTFLCYLLFSFNYYLIINVFMDTTGAGNPLYLGEF